MSDKACSLPGSDNRTGDAQPLDLQVAPNISNGAVAITAMELPGL